MLTLNTPRRQKQGRWFSQRSRHKMRPKLTPRRPKTPNELKQPSLRLKRLLRSSQDGMLRRQKLPSLSKREKRMRKLPGNKLKYLLLRRLIESKMIRS